MTAPEIILGAALLTLWVSLVERGFFTILAAHIMFNISFVVVTIRARLAGMTRSLEEAGMDLYADGRTTFWLSPSRSSSQASCRPPCWPSPSRSTTM